MAKSHLKLVTPTIKKRTVTPTRRRNGDLRTREYLTEAEVDRLIEAAKGNRWGNRDAAMILLAYRHGLRASELIDLRWDQVEFRTAAHRDAAAGLLGFGLEHDLRGAALGSAIGERDHAGHRQPMPVLHGGVAHVAQLRLSPGGLAVESAVGIAGARMRVVFAPLAVEVGAAVVVGRCRPWGG